MNGPDVSLPISQFYPLLLVLWAMVFWCRSKVFRATLLISVGLHTIFLVRVGGWGTRQEERERIISFTFVQGADETEEIRTEEGIGLPAEGPETPERTPSKSPDEERERSARAEKEPAAPRELRVEEDLPRIEDESLLDFSAHPAAESYRRELNRLINLYRRTPREIVEQGAEVRVKVWFNLSRDGKLNQPIFVDAKIRSSDDIVNQGARDSVVAAADHFPPFPEHVNRAEIWFYVYVDYTN